MTSGDILQKYLTAPDEILFLSNVQTELDAAKAEDMQIICMVRDGVIQTSATHPNVKDFCAISL